MKFHRAIVCWIGCAVPSFAVTLSQIDTFDATVENWIEGGSSDTPPTWAGNGGPGDSAYMHNDSPGVSPGRNMQMWNTTQWQGDFVGAGVSRISMDAANLTDAGGENIHLRIAFDGEGGWFVTNPLTLLPQSGWTHLEFDIGELDLIYAGSGSGEYLETMQEVERMQIISMAPGEYFEIRSGAGLKGDQILASLGLDNIRAEGIPEPGSLVLLGWGVLAAARRKRK